MKGRAYQDVSITYHIYIYTHTHDSVWLLSVLVTSVTSVSYTPKLTNLLVESMEHPTQAQSNQPAYQTCCQKT